MKLSYPTIIFFITMHVLALVALLPQYWSWGSILVWAFLSWLTVVPGLSGGYHRLLTHRSYTVPRWVERICATCGALSAEYGPITWVGIHRQHHKYSDTELDPHSSSKGFWWSHIGWMLVEVPAEKVAHKFAQDLVKDPYYRWLDKWFLLLQIPLGVILYNLGGWSFVLWGIPLRMIYVFHLTWFINSACHLWGSRPSDTGDMSTNNRIFGILSFGEGWHNDHHAYPNSAKVGLRGELDITWLFIVSLKKLGLARNVRLPSNI